MLGPILGRAWRTQLEKHEEPDDKNPHFVFTRLILDLMRSLVNRWSLFTHYMSTSRLAATTQMTARVSPAMHLKVFRYFLRLMTFLPQPSLFPDFGTGSEYAGVCHHSSSLEITSLTRACVKLLLVFHCNLFLILYLFLKHSTSNNGVPLKSG